LAAPGDVGGTVVLAQFLDVKHWEITFQAHPKMLSLVILALKSEMMPAISKPLNAINVAELWAPHAHGRPVGAYAMAFLCASLGRSEDAKRWVAEYHKAFVNWSHQNSPPTSAEKILLIDPGNRSSIPNQEIEYLLS